MFLPLILIFVIFYFLIFRPQQKQQKQKQKMINELKRGDEVVTNGGIYGKISDLAESFVMLQIANNVTIKLDRSQVNTVRGVPETQMAKK
ncbi:MAG: preprotein translocase subunit YajC [Deltaproteobacteria bacterium]|nr:preprotein translocase subunit YajC [Deltaproteobacteria bacterium]